MRTTKPQLLKFVPAGSTILRRECHKLSAEEIQSKDTQILIDNLFHTIQNSSHGVGLSANQVGISKAISVIDIKPTPARPNLQPFSKAYINAEITKTFGKKVPMWEGCLSTAVDKNHEPSMAQVPRFKKIQIKYFNQKGQTICETIDGFLAHVLQHEIDHLHGILFTDLISKNDLISYQDYIKQYNKE